jgi:hypothetical protein
MSCRDLEELLSAYADGELNRTQKEFIEEHLECCADCRATFSEFTEAGRLLSALELMPRSTDIRENIISKIKAIEVSSGSNLRRLVRPILAIGTVLLVLAVFYLAYPWEFRTPAASAATIARNSHEVKAFFDDEQIEEVEVTTRVVGMEGDVLVVLVKTEKRTAAAEVNLKKKIVTNIIRVPDFQPGDEEKALEIASADPRVQEILAKGGTISQTHLGYSIEGETVIPTALLTIEHGKYNWNISVNLQEKTIISMGRAQPSPAMTAVYISEFVTRFIAPVLLLLGILIVSGLAFGYRQAGTIAGGAALVLGIIGMFMALYSLSSIWWRQVLSVGIPTVGLIIGIADLRQRGRRHWMSITGIVLCSLALALVFLNEIMLYLGAPGEDIADVIIIAVVTAGIIAYALYNQLKKRPFRWISISLATLLAAVVTVVFLASYLPGQTGSAVSSKATIQEGDQVVRRTFGLMKRQSMNELIKNADAIVIGKVTDIPAARKSTLNRDGKEIMGLIYTDVIIQVDRYLYGESESEKIAVRVEGGRVDNMIMWSEDTPEFILGEEVFLFLIRPPGALEPVPEGIDASSYYRVSIQGKYRYWHGILTNRDGGGLPTCTWFVGMKIAAIHGK